jgi:hypothetical protein
VNLLELNGVQPAYVHRTKLVVPGQSIALGDAVLKWYDIGSAEEPAPAAVSDLARLALADAARLGELRLGASLGFVILHRCGESFYFLLVCTWQNDNELWETVWAKDGDDRDFHPWPLEGSHRPTFCVWELGAVGHERTAWSRFLQSARDRDARLAYLRDTFAGAV